MEWNKLVIFLCWTISWLETSGVVINGIIGQKYSYLISQRDIVVVNYDIKKLNVTNPARIHVTKSGNESDPVFVVVRQGRDVVSWDLPYWSMSGQQYNFVARTVCPYMTDSALSVTISSASVHGINVEMHVNVQATYLLTKDRPAETSATPTQPRYFRFEFPPETEVVFVEAVSPNTSCATLFMFKSCSVHQLIEHSNIKESYRQTMTTNGGLMVHRHIYPKGYFYVGFVVHSNDDICSDNDTLTPIDVTPISSPIRVKNITLTIHDITHVESIESLFSLIGFFAVLIAVITLCWLAYTLGGKDCCVNFWTRWLRRRRGDRSVPNSPLTASCDGSVRSVADGDTSINQEHGQALDPLSRGANQDNPAQTDSDEVFHEVEVKDMARVKMEKTEEILSKFSNIREMMVSDLCWHNEEALTGVTHLFSWILGVVMIYNGLPVIYMMIVYQLNIHKTGDMDWCYYNFYCAHPLMFLSDFNHIVSNVGYGLLGLFFLVIVKVESWKVKDPECGIPRQFGLYYAMGWSLFAECVCSTCYHICPNRFNFQIDTCFMFVISVVCMLQLYHKRHPSITMHPKNAFALLAVLCIVSWLGELLDDRLWWWFVFAFLHTIVAWYCAFHMYYFGQGSKLRPDMSCRGFEWTRPAHPLRFTFMALFLLLNLGFDIYGLVAVPENFASFLLYILIANLGLGTLLYVIMKAVNREGLSVLPLACLFVSIGFWWVGIYYFKQFSTSWESSPALSRTLNKQCVLLGFFDYHDIWHVCSSLGLFSFFCCLLTIDKNLEHVPRSSVRVLF